MKTYNRQYLLVSLFSFLLLAGTATAQPVSKQEARQLASQFMSERGKTISDRAPHRAPRFGTQNAEEASYYVFDTEDNQGFVIISGDSRTESVLGYTDEGSFDAENIPDGMQWLLENYEYQMSHIQWSNLKPQTSCVPSVASDQRSSANFKLQTSNFKPQIYHAPRQARHAVEPLLTTLWNQGEPYNILCPRYFNQDGTTGEHSATGCVATAMAQVVAYYRWPEKLKKSIPGYIQYYDTDQGRKGERRNTIPAGSVIDWDNILDNYNGQHTAQQDTAVAQLMYWVGVDCKMSYGASSASGYSEGVDGLINYFDFDDGTHIEKRDWYTLHAWDEMIYNEIASGHPVPYGGQNSGGGHAFVLDGYSIDGLYHVNWGWGGMSNGYFRIDILDPDNHEGIGASQTPGGYNMGQDCIIGMKRPDGIKDNPPSRHRLSANDWEIRGTNKIFANFVNWTGISASWNTGIGYVNDEGGLTLIGSYMTDQINPNYYVGHEFTVRGLQKGTYRIVPISKRSTDATWICHVCPERNYIYTEVDENGQVVKMEIRPTEEHIEMTNLSFTGNHKRGDQQSVSATFRNNGEDEYFKEIHLLASRTQDKGEAYCRTAIAIAHGEETTIALSFKPEQSGTWNVWLATDRNGNNVVGQGSFEVTDEGITTTHNLRYVTHTVTNRSNGIIYGNQLQGKLSVRNQGSETYDGMIRLWMFKRADNGYYYGAQSTNEPIYIEPGKTTQITYSFRDLDLNANYVMSILYPEGGDIQDGGLKAMGDTRAGILYWNQNFALSGAASTSNFSTPSGAIAVDMRGTNGAVKNVKPNNNPNTIYVVDQMPEGLEGHNVVVGTTADEINLVDNYSVYSPVTFTAKKATYTRSAVETGWETIALPFAANLPEGNVIVEQFGSQNDDGTINFQQVSSMEANIPYVIRSDEPFTVSAADTRFSATDNALMVMGTDDYRFVGTTNTQRPTDIYMLNDEGTAFVPAATGATVKPFRAYFTSTLPAEERLSEIPINLDTEKIYPTPVLRQEEGAVYDLQGRRVKGQMGKGIYIRNNKKYILK